MKSIKTVLLIILIQILLISCSKNQFSSPAGLAIQQHIGEEYLEYPLVELNFEKLIKGKEMTRLGIAIYDSVYINQVLSEERFDDYGIISSADLLRPDYFSQILDTFSVRFQRNKKEYSRLYDICYTFNHWGNDIVLPMKFIKLSMDMYSRLYDKLSTYKERYIELAGKEAEGIGVVEYFVNYKIKSNPNSIEVNKYRMYQLYLPSYSIASMQDIKADDFPEKE